MTSQTSSNLCSHSNSYSLPDRKRTIWRRHSLSIALLMAVLATQALSSVAEEPAASQDASAVDYGGAIEQLALIVQDELERGIVSGVSIALIDDQRVVLATGFGLADKERQTPATATTVYRVGSISKLFTALAAMQLVERGKLELDTPIQQYLPDFRIESPRDEDVSINLRQLMCHRSGMVRESPVGGYLDDTQPGIAATVASLESCTLVNPPNSKTRYSNVGPTIVGQAVAAVSGKVFEDYQQQHLLGPLGMAHSAWRMNDAVRSRLSTSYMRVTDGRGGFFHRASPKFELGTVPAGNLYSTAADMAEFAKMLLAGGKAKNGRIIKAKTLREMSTPQLTDDESGFGLGFHIETFSGHNTIQHTGAVYGFSSSLVVLPEPKLAAIVLANEDIAMGPVRRLSHAALSLLLQAKTGQQPDPPPAPVSLDSEQLAALVGEYESPSYWAEIRVTDTRVQANVSGQPMDLTPIEALNFLADGRFVHQSPFEFQQDANGRVTGFTALGKQFDRIDPDRRRTIPSAWNAYLGSYGPEFIPLVLSSRHGRLYAMTENMVDYRLTPVNQLVFRMPKGLYADEYLVIQLGPDDRAQSVNLANMTLPRRP